MYEDQTQMNNPTLFGKKVVGTKVNKGTQGIVGLHLENGSIVDMEFVKNAIRQGNISGLTISSNQYGEYVKSLNDGNEGNNLDS